MPGDGLDELDVGASGDQARNAGVPEVVEAVAGALEGGAPDAAVEVRLVQRRSVSRSNFDRRVLPLLETVDMPWGTRLVPVDELERLVAQRRRPVRGRAQMSRPGRPTAVPDELVRHIRAKHAKGESTRQIARDLNASQTPTAHGGAQWWPSTVRAILRRASA